jgi:hypothetical protein
MSKSSVDLSVLFESNALQVSPSESPFLYTSGLIGPYYINTHFLCGGGDRAKEILSFIDVHAEDADFPDQMLAILRQQYEEHSIFRDVIDSMIAHLRSEGIVDGITHVSGGQRRDWFFSPIIGDLLGKPNLYIYNDMRLRDQNGQSVTECPDARVLHVADLLTVGSSYTAKWISALRKVGASLTVSLNVVDREQGGVENLTQGGISRVDSLFHITADLFDEAKQRGLIDEAQHALLLSYACDQFGSMRSFLLEHPDFLERMKGKDRRSKERAERCVDLDLYKLGSVEA